MNETAAVQPATEKGRRTRMRIVQAAATVLHRQGVDLTMLTDVRALAGVSSSHLHHYFADEQALVRAGVDYQSDTIVRNEQEHRLDSIDAFRRRRDAAVLAAEAGNGQGGCPLGSLGAELAETDALGREHVADGFTRWLETLENGLTVLRERGDLPAVVDTHDLAVSTLATMQGGLLLSQVQRSADPLRAALDGAIVHLELLMDRARTT